jgi:hypothetical protein
MMTRGIDTVRLEADIDSNQQRLMGSRHGTKGTVLDDNRP